MDDLIFLLLDLVGDLLGWLWPLIGKFWFLIVGYIGYKIFGQAAKKAGQDQKRRTLTPVESGGFPTPQTTKERKVVRASSKYEPVQADSREQVGMEYEGLDRPYEVEQRKSSEREDSGLLMEETPNSKSAIRLDPREGMKWALIFGEPRSKAPYASPNTRRRSE